MMLRLLIALALVVSAIASHAADLTQTALGQAAATLQPGQAVKLNTPTYQSVPMEGDQYYYGDSAAWNPIKQRIEYVAAAVTGDPRHYYLYDVATDAWSVDDAGLWTGNGHGFDSNAVDTVSGIHYFAKYGGPVVARDDATGTWAALPATPFVLGTTPALEYLPGSGLVVASRNGNIAVWNGATWINILGAVAWGNTENWISVVGDTAYIGVSSVMYALKKDATQDSGYKLTLVPAPPVPMGNSQALHTTDGTRLIVALKSGAMWYEFDGAEWKERPELVSGAVVNRWNYYITYIPEIQSIVTMSMRSGIREVWIVKMGAAAPPPPPPTCTPQSAIPPEFWGLPLCTAARVEADPCKQAGVVICDRFDGTPLAGTLYRASSGLTMPKVVNGELQMELVSNGGKDTGHYRVTFPPVGEGGMLAFSYRKRLDAEAMKHQGSKDFIVWGPAWAPSCTTQQLVMTHMYAGQVPIPYRSCGLGIGKKLADGDTRWQRGDFDCRYRTAKLGNYAKCHTKQADTWAQYYVEIKVGHYGQTDSRFVAHVKTDGAWRALMDFPFMLPSSVPLETMMLTGYMTDEVVYTHPLGRIAFDDFIVSTKPLDLALL